nr:hypothetical protein [Tanacetum cinerariifolium]
VDRRFSISEEALGAFRKAKSTEDRYMGKGYDRGQEAKQKHVEIMIQCSKLVASRDNMVNMAARDSDDALVCFFENNVEGRIIDYGASFHATYCKEELERFKLRFGKDVRYISGLNRRLISVGQLDEEGYHHQRFGDMSRICMNMLGSKGNVSDVRKVDIYFCKPGGLGKRKKLYFIMTEKTKKL